MRRWTHARIARSGSSSDGVHHPAERGRAADTVIEHVGDSYADPDGDEFTHSVATPYSAPDDGRTQRALRDDRVGIDRANTSLPVHRPR